MTRTSSLLTALVVAAAIPATAQQGVRVTTSVFGESYTFDEGLGFDRVSQMTIPLGFNFAFGRYVDVAISTGFTHIDLALSEGGNETLTGLVDSEVRVGVNAIPGRLVLIVGGTIPSPLQTVEPGQLAIVGAVASDVIGFSTSNTGGGGNISGGFAGAIPIGSWAFGFGATAREYFKYQPVITNANRLSPGMEMKVRGGLEGPLGRRSYLRLAGVFAHRQKDEISETLDAPNETQNGIGNRLIGYVSFDQGLGNANLVLYAFDVFRMDPQREETAVGAALFPRGNLVAFGARLIMRPGRQTSLIPRMEFRESRSAPDADTKDLQLAGRSFRLGIDLQRTLSRRFTLVLQGSGVFGIVVPPATGDRSKFRGARLAVQGQWRP